MRYVGHIYRLYLMIKDKENTLSFTDIVNKIYDLMNKDDAIIGGITKTEIEQAIRCRVNNL